MPVTRLLLLRHAYRLSTGCYAATRATRDAGDAAMLLCR